MSKNLNLFKSVISDYTKHLSGEKIREFEAEDPLSKSFLRQRLCEVNSKRTVLFAVSAAIVSVIFSVLIIINISISTIRESVFSLISLFLTATGGLCCAVVIYRELNKKRAEIQRSERFVFVYWILFSLGSLLISAADFSVNVFAYRFCLYLAIMIVFPLFETKRALLLIIPYLAVVLSLGAVFGASAEIYIISAALAFAYLIISSLVYSSFCCLFISDRQLNTANERCRQINEKDASTGLLNKKGLINRLNEIMNRGAEKNIAAVFFDIDDFRRYNHIYTDTESDECLYNVCNCVRIVAKSKTDIISRYGGDEFVIIVQNTTEYELIYFAEQIRKSVERMALPFEDGKIVTVSIGVSSIVEGELDDYSVMLKEAEDSLVLAKNGGRNCVGYMGNVFRAN